MDKRLSVVEHLDELRRRIIFSLIALVIATAFCFPFASGLLKILKLPASGALQKLAFFSPQEAFLIYLRIAFFGGLVISLPVILYNAWAFILPALEENLRRYALFFMIFCSGSFIGGSLFAYFVLIPPALRFLLSFGGGELDAVISASKYISFVITLILGCGLVFQMPTLSLALTKLGIITPQLLRKKYKYAIVAVFIISAIITPTPDAFNMLIMAIPMLFLYEVSIWISFLVKSR